MTPGATADELGRRLTAARLRRGRTQAEVAERAGLDPSYLSRIENGRIQPTFRTVVHLVEVLGADLSELVGPRTRGDGPEGPCPVTARGRCLLDLIRPEKEREHYSPREVRLLRRFAAWLERVEPSRVRAMEILLDDLTAAADRPPR